MQRVLSIAGLVVSGLIALLFAADLAVGIPFGRRSWVMDVGTLTCALLLCYLSYNAMRESG